MKEKTILLVEADPDDAALAIRALRQNNLLNEIVVARDGAGALELLFGTVGTPPIRLPEFVLLALNLPESSGLEVLRRIRSNKRTRLLPVVVMVPPGGEKARMECCRLGANSCIAKPPEPAEFGTAVMQLGIYWLVHNVGPYSNEK